MKKKEMNFTDACKLFTLKKNGRERNITLKKKSKKKKTNKRFKNRPDRIRAGISTGKPGSRQRIDDLQKYYAGCINLFERAGGGNSPFEGDLAEDILDILLTTQKPNKMLGIKPIDPQ